MEKLGFLRAHAIRGAGGIDARREEGLIRVDVAHPGDPPLVHEDLLHRLSRGRQDLSQALGREAGIERLGPDGAIVGLPALLVQQQQRAQAADIAVHEATPVVQARREDRISGFVG